MAVALETEDYKYNINDSFLCRYGGMLYHSKCIDRYKEHGLSKYYIHYKNWNSNFDEWVEESRLLDVNEENLKLLEDLKLKEAKQKKIMAALKKSKTKRRKRSTTVVKVKKNEGLTLSKQKKNEISSKNIITTKKRNHKHSTTEDKTKTNLTTEVEVGVFIEKLNDVLLQVTNEFESHSPEEEKIRVGRPSKKIITPMTGNNDNSSIINSKNKVNSKHIHNISNIDESEATVMNQCANSNGEENNAGSNLTRPNKMEDNVLSIAVPKNDSICHENPVIVLYDLNKMKKIPSTNKSNNLKCQHPKNITSKIETKTAGSNSRRKHCLHTGDLQKSKKPKTHNVPSIANPVPKEQESQSPSVICDNESYFIDLTLDEDNTPSETKSSEEAGHFGSLYTIPKIEPNTEIIDHDANSYGHSNLTRPFKIKDKILSVAVPKNEPIFQNTHVTVLYDTEEMETASPATELKNLNQCSKDNVTRKTVTKAYEPMRLASTTSQVQRNPEPWTPRIINEDEMTNLIDLTLDDYTPPRPRIETFMINQNSQRMTIGTNEMITFNIYINGNARDGQNNSSHTVNIHNFHA